MITRCEKKEADEQIRPPHLLSSGHPQSARRTSKPTFSSRQPGLAEQPHHLYLFPGKPSCQLSLRFSGGMSRDDLKRYYILIVNKESLHSIRNKDRSENKKKSTSRETLWHALRQILTRTFLRKDKENLAEAALISNSSKISSLSEPYTHFSVSFNCEVHVSFIPHAADYSEHVWASHRLQRRRAASLHPEYCNGIKESEQWRYHDPS